jgi:hypothetical protein
MCEENIKIIVTEEQKKHFQEKNNNLSPIKGTSSKQHRLSSGLISETLTTIEKKKPLATPPPKIDSTLAVTKQPKKD